jgi:hypothetical protein
MTTATTIIEDALGALGLVAPGESGDADHLVFGLRLLNREIDTLSADGSVDYRTEMLTFQASTAAVTIGLTGSVVTNNRVDVLKPGCYASLSGSDYPIKVATTRAEYTEIVRKTQQGPVPVVVWLDSTYPDATAYFWPTPQGSATITLAIGRKTQAFASLTEDKTLQAGMEQALVDILTVRMAANFKIDPPKQAVLGMARALRLIRMMRLDVPQMTVKSVIGSGQGNNLFNSPLLSEAFDGSTTDGGEAFA